jgi:hypothetical protein
MLRVLGNTKKRERTSFGGAPYSGASYVTAGVKVDVDTTVASQASSTSDSAPSAQTLAYRAEMKKLHGKGNILLDTTPRTNIDVANDIAAQKAQEIVGVNMPTLYNDLPFSITDMPELRSDAYEPGEMNWNPELEKIMKPVVKKWWEEAWFTYGMFGFSVLSGIILYMKNRKEPDDNLNYSDNNRYNNRYDIKGGNHAQV